MNSPQQSPKPAPFGWKEKEQAATLIRLALAEDLDPCGKPWGKHADATSLALIPADLCGQAVLVSRVRGIVAGVEIARMVFEAADPNLTFRAFKSDGDNLLPGDRIALIEGPMRGLLLGERTALNFLQKLSGIASWTATHAELIADLPVVLLDTRKTTPGWRYLEKFAVRMGKATNHRMSLADGILVKDNHLAALAQKDRAGAERAGEGARLAREFSRAHGDLSVEIEVDGMDQLSAVLVEFPDIVLLDNFSIGQLCEAVSLRNKVAPEVLLEASGGIRLENLREVALTGVDRISVGGLIHQARSIDLALDYCSAGEHPRS